MNLLPLPISATELQGLIFQALDLLPFKMSSANARAEITAICLQESGLSTRRQYGNGPARGLAQFEKGGGVHGVMTHSASRDYARDVCEVLHVPFTETDVWQALEFNDVLALAFARLLLWTDPRALPAAVEGHEQAAWEYYYRNWRPGKPHRERWGDNWAQGCAAVRVVDEDPS